MTRLAHGTEGIRPSIVDFIHAHQGLASINHPFRSSDSAGAAAAAPAAAAEAVAADLLAVRAGGADILEVGYADRHGGDLSEHLAVWDTMSRNAVFLTANGVSDDHSGNDWAGQRNRFYTAAWAGMLDEPALVGSLAAGRAYVAYLGGFGGTTDVTGVPTGGAVQVVRGTVDNAGTGTPTPNSTVVRTRGAADLEPGYAMEIDTPEDCFHRLQVIDSAGAVVGFGQPIWVLTSEPANGIPEARRSTAWRSAARPMDAGSAGPYRGVLPWGWSSMTGPRRVVILLGLLALLVGGSPAVAPPAAATYYGHDISWPQCPTSMGGFGLPMPPTTTQFVIIGLTRGLAFTENPCLASQVQWARTYGKSTQAYAMATFPTAAQLSAHARGGPWSSATRAGQLSNVGYAEARYALNTLQRIGYDPRTIWIDVEPRTAQPWPVGTTARERENRYVIEGMMRAFRDSGRAYGFYSYTAGWQEITGGWRLPGVPVWATAGRLDYPNEAHDRCVQPSFSGGRVYISQWYDDTRDYDLTCGSYGFTPLAVPPSSLSNSTADWNGDWNNDVLARASGTGELYLHGGMGTGALAPRVRIGAGWQVMNALDTPGDISGDGAADVLAREGATGDLWLYPGNGRGGFLPRIRAGAGWQVMNAIVGPGDFSGDQRADLLAREAATGALWLYRGTGTGGWLPRVRIGAGWHIFNAIVGTGDFTGDGAADVIAREASNGRLWLYPGNGSGGWLPRVQVGTGWHVMRTIVGVGDLNGDRAADVLAVEAATGNLWLYPGNGAGGWRPRIRIGTNAGDSLF